jgi:hexulose-6-phosphate isomerase
MTRRDFVAAAVPALAAVTTGSATAGARLPIRKAVLFEMLPKSLSIADRFKLARDTGFEAASAPPHRTKARRMKSRRSPKTPDCRFIPS